MENLQTTYEFKVWTNDFIIPKEINLKSIINNKPSTTSLVLIELRVQEFLLLEKGHSIVEEPRGPFAVISFCLLRNAVIHDDAAGDSLCEILSSPPSASYCSRH
ncbi:hypothetical protein RND71_040481 [Anisodus tanguticus]|uniref:Uncharacterized protein n=1 Tax=Anisodus tanguticus TaxID=243964 RepID=A0AAE1QTL0_9SOLA|nr:hypothetical protein RND71_040481 [Anisodus tanguticus]